MNSLQFPKLLLPSLNQEKYYNEIIMPQNLLIPVFVGHQLHNAANKEFTEWKVNELKVELKKKNLPVSGSKSQLVERLKNYSLNCNQKKNEESKPTFENCLADLMSEEVKPELELDEIVKSQMVDDVLEILIRNGGINIISNGVTVSIVTF
jgi:hypothetical protein